jgi:alpha-beta hydrolase superfamily lysophospholipase
VAPAAGGGEPVGFQTEDGVTVRGHFYANAGPKRRLVIFAPENLGANDQRAYQPFARELAAQGIAALTFDFRGYGETGGAQDAAKIDRDLRAAVLFMKSRDYPLVYVVGSVAGAAAAIKVAITEELAGIVAVSTPPAVGALGFDARADIARVSEPKLFLAATVPEPDALTLMMAVAPEPKLSQRLPGSGQGADLLTGPTAAAFKQAVVSFVNR